MTALTKRERIILDLVQQGLTNSKIAIETNINPSEVNKHIRIIKEKLYVCTKQDLIELAKIEQDQRA